MYDVLIVDDEVISRLGIVNLIDWEAQGFNVVGSVSNGVEALELMKKQEIDLVITDIKMPVMNGIELIQSAKSEKLKSTFIVLSSFDDYTYVREALKIGAVDYILKLDLDANYLINVLSKAKESIEVSGHDTTAPKPLDRQTLMNAKRELLKQMLYGRSQFDETLASNLNTYELNMPFDKYCVLMYKVENLDQTINEDGIRQIIEEVLVDYNYAYVCDTGFDELSIIYNMDISSEHDQHQAIHKLGNRIVYIMKQYFNQKVTVFVSQTISRMDEIPLAYLQVCQALGLKSFVSEETIVFFNDVIANRNYRDYKSFESFIHRFEKSYQNGMDVDINHIFDELIAYVDHSKYIELNQIRYFMSSMIYIANYYLDKFGLSKEMLWESEEQQYHIFQNIQRKSDFIEFINELREKMNSISADQAGNHIVRNVKKYLKQHYMENVILKDISSDFGVTNTYLSMLFKKETGETLKDYLTHLKIEKAKQLLKETNQQIVEIASTIGYDNEHYFSRIFKMKTGQTPSSYRNIG